MLDLSTFPVMPLGYNDMDMLSILIDRHVFTPTTDWCDQKCRKGQQKYSVVTLLSVCTASLLHT